MPKGGVFVLDCLGKFNIHRFMNLLKPLKVYHSVLFDGDDGRPPHDQIRQLIEGSSNEYTRGIDTFPDDIEAFLSVNKSTKPYRKPQHVMLKLNESKIPEDNLNQFIKKIVALIS